VNARDFLAELAVAGVHLSVAGDDLKVRGEPGVSLAPHLDRIRTYKPALLAELLRVRIVGVVTVEPAHFERDEYERLWSRLRRLESAS
jgi:hypothetical protein